VATLVIDRSTKLQSAAIVSDEGDVKAVEFGGTDSRSGAWAEELLAFISDVKIDRIAVGTGPGSFAGIRAALAFAQGYSVGSGCEVLGLPSACALVDGAAPLTVIGDSRRGRFWIATFDGYKMIGDVVQVDRETLPKRVARGVDVVSVDHERIGETLKEIFGDRYKGGALPKAEGLARFFINNPSVLKKEPLPIYLNPAVAGPEK
jgi:tRNA threonylcarbamoyl adenosine modification protein YeaZ